MTTFANVGGIADPRLGKEADAIPNKEISVEPAAQLGTAGGQYVGHNKNISFEEYHYYANWTRAYEKTLDTKGRGLSSITSMFIGKGKSSVPVEQSHVGAPPPDGAADAYPGENGMQAFGVISDYEWHQASRAARTATWGAVFYLITTDILGPFSVPWAMSQLGYGPGVVLYLIFGILAG